MRLHWPRWLTPDEHNIWLKSTKHLAQTAQTDSGEILAAKMPNLSMHCGRCICDCNAVWCALATLPEAGASKNRLPALPVHCAKGANIGPDSCNVYMQCGELRAQRCKYCHRDPPLRCRKMQNTVCGHNLAPARPMALAAIKPAHACHCSATLCTCTALMCSPCHRMCTAGETGISRVLTRYRCTGVRWQCHPVCTFSFDVVTVPPGVHCRQYR